MSSTPNPTRSDCIAGRPIPPRQRLHRHGWLDKVTHAKAAELTSTAYTRSAAGRVSTETTPAYSRTFSYDGAGRLSKTVEGTVTRNYRFDANSNRCSTGAACDASYAYDQADRVTASPFGSGYGYDSHGNLTSISSLGAGGRRASKRSI